MSHSSHRLRFTAEPRHIDVNGHVNNAVWVQWMEDLSTAHWEAVAPAEHQQRYAWLVTRHEIDYRGNIREGESVEGVTEIREGPRGPQFTRHYSFRNEAGKAIVTARTRWAMIDRETLRLTRVPAEVAAPFLPVASGE
ncbi:acyl-CoA thioesterase [Altericroceibacterium endophyticum]|uniref:Acyl-CoA thioesterase n=1 Tax=Altericroceibacterium endophyticum TaxID=1808508 RepID=A0A6I4T4N2_9SPHN|nr:acyl-CoA thioesterase [Altericroceibacterium endophyticum]MXO65846.1 acyl-CoA thioesterase [Altericroceibacterium endophyticum]